MQNYCDFVGNLHPSEQLMKYNNVDKIKFRVAKLFPYIFNKFLSSRGRNYLIVSCKIYSTVLE